MKCLKLTAMLARVGGAEGLYPDAGQGLKVVPAPDQAALSGGSLADAPLCHTAFA